MGRENHLGFVIVLGYILTNNPKRTQGRKTGFTDLFYLPSINSF